MSNTSSIIAELNKSLLRPKITEYGCSCRVKTTFPLQNQCQTSSLLHRADVESEVKDETKIYFGLAATTFKERFGNHKKDFNQRQHGKNIEFSKYVWSLKDPGITYSLKWSRVEKVTKIDRCLLCLAEKLHLIEYFDDICLLNKKVNLLTTVGIKISDYLKVQ